MTPLYIDYGDDWPPRPPAPAPSPSRARRIGRALRPYGERAVIWAVVYAVLSVVFALRPPAPFDPSAERPEPTTHATTTVTPPLCSVTRP